MLDLMRVVYWFDEHLQAELSRHGWGRFNRSQSLVLANIATGQTRAARIAESIGVSRQAMSQLIAELTARQVVALRPDPDDRRALIVEFAPEALPLRAMAEKILRDLEQRMAAATSRSAVDRTRELLQRFLASAAAQMPDSGG
jgi:DNA-binding MarR family transcriptional regulator